MQQWIRGEMDEDYTVISGRQATDLTVINTKGEYQTRNEFNTRYKKFYGKYEGAKLNVKIMRTKRLHNQKILAVYHQTTKLGDKVTDRMTTTIFRYKEDLKNNAEWIHVHVTQMIS